MLFFICPDSMVVARTQACDFPKEVFDKPEISTYPFDIESILAMDPDLVFSEEGITSPEQQEILERNGISLYMFRYSRVEDIFDAINKIGEFCDCQEETKSKVDSLKWVLNSIKTNPKTRLKALGIIWTDPIYVYGKNTLFSDQMDIIGLKNAVDSVFIRPYPEISREYLLKINPDIIYGSSFEHLDSSLFNQYPELKRINAYKDSSIFYVDGDILTRPGPRSFEALKKMKEVLE